MTTLDHRAERLKYARIFGVDAADLDVLDDVEVDDLRRVRQAAEDALFHAAGDMFDRMVAASRLLPNAVVARIAQATVPPLLAARVAGLISPDRASDLVRHIAPAYLSDMAAHLDPRTVADVIPALPRDVMVAVAQETVPRGDFVTMGRMVGLAPPDVVRPLVDAVEDDEALLHIAFMLEDRERLGPIVDEVPDERIGRVAAVARDRGLWVEALALMTFVDDRRKRRLGILATQQPEDVLTSLMEAATCDGLWPEVLSIVSLLDDDHLAEIADLPPLVEPATLQAVMAAADAHEHWPTVVRVVATMSANTQEAVAGAAEITADQQARAAGAADAADLRGRLGGAEQVLLGTPR